MISQHVVLLLLLQPVLVELCNVNGDGAPQSNPTFKLSVAREPPWLTMGNAEGSVTYALQKVMQDEKITSGQFNYKITVTVTKERVPLDLATPLPASSYTSWAQYSGSVAITGTAPSGFWTRVASRMQSYLIESNNIGVTSMKTLSQVTIAG
uniref:Uncharacterized protein n=1 Tax=Plectus sambesii TaxID=2011161 RepID=A0A914X2P7_9BILA